MNVDGDNRIRLFNSAASGHSKLEFQDNSNDLIAFISSSGNVGIGTATSSQKLRVQGDFRVDSGFLLVTNGAGSTTEYLYHKPISKAIELNVTSSNTTFDPQFLIRQDNVVKAQFGWDDDGGNELFIVNAANGPIQFKNSSTELARITNSGNLGIGVTNPGRKLHISGSGGTIAAKIQAGDGNQASLDLTNSEGAFRIISDGGALDFYDDTDSKSTLKLKTNQQIQIGEYGAGNFTGTAAQRLAVDSSGNVIEIPIGAGAVDGSGAANKLAIWSDTDTLTSDSVLHWDTSNDRLGIGTDSPLQKLHLRSTSDTRAAITAHHASADASLDLLNTVDGKGWRLVHKNQNTFEIQHASSLSSNSIGSVNTYFHIGTTGNVGIGTTSPARALHAVHSDDTVALFESADTIARIELKDDADSSYLGTSNGTTFLGSSTSVGATENLKISADGQMAIGMDTSAQYGFAMRRNLTLADQGKLGFFVNFDLSGDTALSSDRTYAAYSVDMDSSATGGNQSQELILKGYTANVRSTGDANDVYGYYADVVSATSTANSIQNQFNGGFFRVLAQHSDGNIQNMRGIAAEAMVNGATSATAIGTAQGVRGVVNINATSTTNVTNAYGGFFKTDFAPQTTGTSAVTSAAYGVYGEVESDSTTSLSNARSIAGFIDANSGSLFQNAYQFYGSTSINANATINNSWGIYSIGASKHRLDGNVGIGTDSPATKLHVEGFARLNGGLQLAGSNRYVYAINNTSLLLGTNNTERMRIDSSGNVGIGTTAPVRKLHVEGNSGGNELFLAQDTNSTLGTHIGRFKQLDGTNNPYLDISSTSTGMLVNTGFSTGIPGSFVLQSNGGSSYLAFNTNGANERMRIDSSGNVGIGITTPNEKLHVEGTSRFSGDMHFGSAVQGLVYRPVEGGSAIDRFFLMFDETNNASFPFLTNRTPNGAVVIKTGTAAGGAENEHFRIKGGDGTVDAYFTNANLGIGTTSPKDSLEITNGNLLVVPSASIDSSHSGLVVGFNKHSSTEAGLFGASDGIINNSDGNLYVAPRNINPGNGAYLLLGQRDSTTANEKGIVRLQAGTSGSNGQIGDMFFGYGNSQTVKLEGSSGNVGIGITSPEEKLSVDGNIQLPNQRQITWSDFGDGNTGRVAIRGNEDDDTLIFRLDNQVRATLSTTGLDLGGNLTFSGAARDILIIDNDATALEIKEGSNLYMRFNSTNGAENILLHKATSLSSTLSVTGNINVPDDSKLILGTGNDLQLYHDSTSNNSIISEGGTGILSLRGTNLRLQNAAGTKSYLRGENGGATTLFHNNSVRLATTAAGVDITGDMTVSGKLTAQEFHTEFVSASIIYDSGSTKFGDTEDDVHDFTGSLNIFSGSFHLNPKFTNTSGLFKITHGPIASDNLRHILVENTGSQRLFRVNTDANGHTSVDLANNGTERVRIGTYWPTYINNGGYSTRGGLLVGTGSYTDNYYGLAVAEGGSSGSLNVADTLYVTGSRVGIGTATPGYNLHNTGTSRLEGRITLGGNVNNFIEGSGTAITFKSNNDYSFTKGAATLVTIKDSGKVGIGTTSPLAKLHLQSSENAATSNLLYLENVGSGGDEGVSIKFNPMFNAESMIASNREGAFSNVSNLTFHTYSGSMAEAMRITSTGNVGIGTTTPAEKLTVEGNISSSGQLNIATAEDTVAIFESTDQNSNVVIKDSNATSKLVHSLHAFKILVDPDDADSNSNFRIEIDGDEALRIKSNRNVGIGTSNPESRLHITDANPVFIMEDTSNPNKNKIENVDGNMRYHADYNSDMGNSRHIFFIDNSEKVRFDTNGNVGIGTTSPDVALHVESADETVARFERNDGSGFTAIDIKDGVGTTGNSAIRFSDTGGSPGEINYEHADNSLRINTNSSERLRITHDGYIGIGATSPSTRLHLSGSSAADAGIRQSRDGVKIWTQEIDSNGKLQWAYRSSEGGSATQHFTLNDTGQAILHGYGSGNFTGTAAKTLAVDSSGNIIETDGGGAGTVDGNGVAGQLTFWQDTDTITGSSDTNTNVNVGRLKIGSYVSDYMYLSHYDYGTSTNYALNQAPTGGTSVNAPTGQSVALKINNSAKLTVASTGNVGIGSTSPAKNLDVVGSFRVTENSGGGDSVTTLNVSTHGQFSVSRNHSTSPNINTTFSSGNSTLNFVRSGTTFTKIECDNSTFSGSVGIAVSGSYTANALADDLVIGNGVGSRGMSIFSAANGSGAIHFADDLDTEGAGDSPAGNRDGVIRYSHGDGNFSLRTGGNQTALTLSHTLAAFTSAISGQTLTLDGSSANIPLYVRSTGIVSYVQIQNSSTGYGGSSNGLTVGNNNVHGYVWNRETGSLYLGTKDTTALHLDSSQVAHFAEDVKLADDKKLKFGAAHDYEIYHNSSTNVNHISSLVDRQLSLNANIINLTNQANSETVLRVSGSRVGIGTLTPATELHISSSNFNDHITLGRDSDELGITVSGGQLLLEGGVTPFTNDTSDLGRSDKHWRNLYITDNIYVSASADLNLTGSLKISNNLTVANNTTTNLLYTDNIQTRNGTVIDFRHQDASVIMRVDTDDAKVGIGSTSTGAPSPTYKLDVQGSTSNTNVRVLTTTGNANYRLQTNNSHFVLTGVGAANQFTIYDSNASAVRQTIESTGKIRFNSYGSATHTGTPAKTLQVDANGNIIEGAIVNFAPKVEYQALSSDVAENTTFTLPNSLSYTVSSGGYEYLEIFLDGIRLMRGIDFEEISTTQVKILMAVPSGSVFTYKSIT